MANVIFDTFKKLMSALHRPITGNEHVEPYEFPCSGLTCPQCVKLHSSLFVPLENLLDGNPFFNGQRSIHQSTDGSSNIPLCRGRKGDPRRRDALRLLT